MRVAAAVAASLTLSIAIGSAGCAKPRASAAAPASVPATAASARAGAGGAQAQSSPTIGSARLHDELARIFDTPSVNALWAVEIQSFDTGEVLFQRNEHTLVMPASNMKLVTMSVASARLGWDFRFATDLVTQGAVSNGVLSGDLIVVGNGDPTISDRDGDRMRVFEQWADKLRALGITRIDGRIIGDDDQFDDQVFGSGWSWDDFTTSSATLTGSLQFNENLVRVVITPASAAGQPATVRLDPEGSGLTLRSVVLTGESTVATSISIARKLGGTTLDVVGVVPVGSGDTTRQTPVENPTIFFVNALRDTLIRKGIAVSGPAIDIDDVPVGTIAPWPAVSVSAPVASAGANAGSAAGTGGAANVDAAGLPQTISPNHRARIASVLGAAGATPPAPLRLLLTHQSPPLSEFGRTFMKVSQNLFGETLMTAIGARSTDPEAAAHTTPTLVGTVASGGPLRVVNDFDFVEAAKKVYEDVLAGWGIPPTEYILADGSGLSRYNYLTAHMLVQILRQMARDAEHAATFEATLPIAGKDGTLSRRMKGTRAEDNVHAKTGTLSGVRSLSGYVRTLDGERIGFSIIANNFKPPTASIDAIAELAVERLANFTRKASQTP